MDIFTIKRIINNYKPHTMISSFPIAVKGEKNDIRIIWFIYNFHANGNNETVRIVVDTAYCMDEYYNVRSMEFKADEVVNYEVTMQPKFDYHEYMNKLGEVIDNNNLTETTSKELLNYSEQFYITDLAFEAVKLFVE